MTIANDALDEADETFVVDLSNPVYATIDDGQGAATIYDDDDAPTISIGDVTVDEDAGTAALAVTMSAERTMGRRFPTAPAITAFEILRQKSLTTHFESVRLGPFY